MIYIILYILYIYMYNLLVNLYIRLTISSCYSSIPLTLGLIGRDGGLSTLCHGCRFACRQRVLTTFPSPGYLRSEDGVVWLTLGNWLFGAVKLTNSPDPNKYGYGGYGTGSDARWQFLCWNDEFCQNVVIFRLDISSSMYFDNKKGISQFLVKYGHKN